MRGARRADHERLGRPPLRVVYRIFALLGLLTLPALEPVARAADPVPQLIRVLGRASDYKQRLAAIIGLARTRDARAVPALIRALKDPNHTVRGSAARVLGTLGDRRARKPLEALLLLSKNDYVRGQAQQALAALMARAEGKQAVRGDEMQTLGTLGTLDRQSIQDGVADKIPRVRSSCYRRRLGEEPYLGGEVGLKFRVATNGSVRWVRFKQSDLGSLEVERCILEVMRGARFGRPQGGEAEFSVPIRFKGGDRVTPLDPRRSRAARRLRGSCKQLLRGEAPRGRLKPPPGLRVTLYVDDEGKVVSAGLSAGGEEIPAEFADRFIANLKQLKLEDPSVEGSHGKLIYPLRCRR